MKIMRQLWGYLAEKRAWPIKLILRTFRQTDLSCILFDQKLNSVAKDARCNVHLFVSYLV